MSQAVGIRTEEAIEMEAAARPERTNGAGSANTAPGPRPKREAIVAAAVRLFLESGYGATSMDAIAAAAEVSKRTVYSYFSGKDVLFEAVMTGLCESGAAMAEEVLPDKPATEVLACIGRRFLNIISADSAIAIFRITAAESERFPELGETFYRCGPQRSIQSLATYLKARDAAGELRVPDPETAATQFFALVKGEIFMRLVLGIGPKPDDAEIERVVGAAVRMFLKGYARDPR